MKTELHFGIECLQFLCIFQAISCLKKSVWLEPTNFNCLFNLGLIYLTAQQYASAFHALAAAVCIRTDFAECYMLLGSKRAHAHAQARLFVHNNYNF